MKNHATKIVLMLLLVALVSCDDDDDKGVKVHDPSTAEAVTVDRFSAAAGTLMVRTTGNGMPAAGEPVNFDQVPFITRGLGPQGQVVEYYNFDVQSTDPAPIYVLFKEGSDMPVAGQLNIIDQIPGDAGYNDFWLVNKVTVPSGYQANEVASLDEINDRGYVIEATNMIVNCPVVPAGSTASKRLMGAAGLQMGWYKEMLVFYFVFEEKELMTSSGKVPLSPIFVTFNINPTEPDGGPGSGFVTEDGTDQTHNVVATIPVNAGYSPLWTVHAYDNADFASVMDLASAQTANLLGNDLASVNCPVVTVQE